MINPIKTTIKEMNKIYLDGILEDFLRLSKVGGSKTLLQHLRLAKDFLIIHDDKRHIAGLNMLVNDCLENKENDHSIHQFIDIFLMNCITGKEELYETNHNRPVSTS